MLLNVMKIIALIILIISVIIGIIRILISTNILNSYINIEDKEDNNYEKYYDLIIVGSGLAGLTAAYETNKIANNSIKILLIETSSTYGGNIKNEIDGINILMPEKKYKDKNGDYIIDNFTSFFDDSFEFGRYLSEKDLLSIMVNNSYYLYDFLFNELNCTSLKITQSEGSKVPRTLIYNNSEINTGQYLTRILYNKIKNISSINISFNSHLIDLIVTKDYKQIKGVIYEIQKGEQILNITAYTKSIILASGGYGADFYTEESLLKEFLIQFYNLPTFCSIYTQGNGIKIARNKGAVLIDQRQGEIYPTCFVDLLDRFNRHKILAPDLLRELGGILMNKRGKRFCNENGNRRYVAQNILKNCDIITDPNIIKQYEGFLIINEEIKENYGEEMIEEYIAKGYLKKYKNFEEFSKDMKISEYYTNIRKSIINYNQGYDKNRDRYGKNNFPCKFKMGEPIYVGIITPCIFHTLGGIRINENAEVLNEEKRPIKGLFAAGEIIGGIHGVMSMQGNILTQSLVFGKLAAKSSIDYIKNNI